MPISKKKPIAPITISHKPNALKPIELKPIAHKPIALKHIALKSIDPKHIAPKPLTKIQPDYDQQVRDYMKHFSEKPGCNHYREHFEDNEMAAVNNYYVRYNNELYLRYIREDAANYLANLAAGTGTSRDRPIEL